MLDSSDVANAILDRAHERAISVSPLKLQKLMYYCQGYFLASHGKRLFNEDVQAWKHGPVVESVYHQYKSLVRLPIPHISTGVYLSSSESVKDMIDYVLDSLGNLGGWALRNKTHNEKPWIESYKASCSEISDKQMTEFFTYELSSKQDRQLASILDASEFASVAADLHKLPTEINSEEDFVNWINA